MKEEEKRKEYFKLIWEYLKRSKDYKKWLESGAPKKWLKWCDKVRTASRKDLPLKVPAKIVAETRWSALFDIWGDVHNSSFEDWWKHRENARKSLNKRFPSIEDYSDRWAGFEIDHCFLNIKNKPTDIKDLQEKFKSVFIERMKNSDLLYLIVDCCEDIKTLKREFTRLIIEKKKEGGVLSRKRDELQRYLNVYDLNEKLTIRQIMEKIGMPSDKEAAKMPYSNKTYKTVERRYRRWLQKAKSTIEDVEQGKL